jgi:hypothetical protein
VAEANNPIRGYYTYNKTDVCIEAFMRKLKAHNANADMYLYTSWELAQNITPVMTSGWPLSKERLHILNKWRML